MIDELSSILHFLVGVDTQFDPVWMAWAKSASCVVVATTAMRPTAAGSDVLDADAHAEPPTSRTNAAIQRTPHIVLRIVPIR